MTRARPSPDALAMAAEWLEQYDGQSPQARQCFAVAAWLRETVQAAHQRQAETMAIAGLAKERGVKPAVIRAQLRRVRAAKAKESGQ